MNPQDAHKGDRVWIMAGRWAYRRGLVTGFSVVYSGRDRVYPTVLLEPTARAVAREVRVTFGSLEPATTDDPATTNLRRADEDEEADRG